MPAATEDLSTGIAALKAPISPAGIPFWGPASKSAWTSGPSGSTYKLGILNHAEASKHLPEDRVWLPYKIPQNMPMREASNMTISQWASMKYWEKSLFFMLFVLSARVPDFEIKAFWSQSTSEMALVVKRGEALFVSISLGVSKNKAQQNVASKMIEDSDLWNWISTTHAQTPCDKYLKKGKVL